MSDSFLIYPEFPELSHESLLDALRQHSILKIHEYVEKMNLDLSAGGKDAVFRALPDRAQLSRALFIQPDEVTFHVRLELYAERLALIQLNHALHKTGKQSEACISTDNLVLQVLEGRVKTALVNEYLGRYSNDVSEARIPIVIREMLGRVEGTDLARLYRLHVSIQELLQKNRENQRSGFSQYHDTLLQRAIRLAQVRFKLPSHELSQIGLDAQAIESIGGGADDDGTKPRDTSTSDLNSAELREPGDDGLHDADSGKLSGKPSRQHGNEAAEIEDDFKAGYAQNENSETTTVGTGSDFSPHRRAEDSFRWREYTRQQGEAPIDWMQTYRLLGPFFTTRIVLRREAFEEIENWLNSPQPKQIHDLQRMLADIRTTQSALRKRQAPIEKILLLEKIQSQILTLIDEM
ncbi:MAG: hypothetical protein KDK34_16710 [Leptospiraceae bacterium]|nr:hypothetical protein [Leptospiraceae bacterium]